MNPETSIAVDAELIDVRDSTSTTFDQVLDQSATQRTHLILLRHFA
jgi:hypothetical protein